MQSQPPPKGSLEELFRHHLLESEAAAVPPRPLVWDHIDNSLLLAQNEKYRRRLLVHRWGMAASLLLATLAGGGWWHSQQVATATLASAHAQSDAARLAVAGATSSRTGTTNNGTTLLADNVTSSSTQRLATGTTAGVSMVEQPVGNQTKALAGNNSLTASTSSLLHTDRADSRAGANWTGMAKSAGQGSIERGQADATAGTVAYATTGQRAHGTDKTAGAMPAHKLTSSPTNSNVIAATATSSSARFSGTLPAVGQPTTGNEAAPAEGIYAQNELAATRMGEASLDLRLVKLALASAALPPAALSPKELLPPAPSTLR